MKPHILILAAGKGKRMFSKLPKVLHPILFRPMIHHLLDRAEEIPHESITLVVGHGEELVRQACAGYPELRYVKQESQLGTAHAVLAARTFLESHKKGHVLILSGDVVSLKKKSLVALIEKHHRENAVVTLMTTRYQNPKGYGRILRDGTSEIVGIREEIDCSPDEKKITEVNAGIYCFQIEPLLAALAQIGNENKQQEYYLPDAITLLVEQKLRVASFELEDPSECFGINDRAALVEVERALKMEINYQLLMSGVTVLSPETTLIDPTCRFGNDIVVEPGCILIGSEIKDGAYLETNVRIERSEIGEGARIKQGSVIEQSTVGDLSQVGPYAHLRPDSHLGREVKVGNFVELKKTKLGDGTKVSHLSYLGDAEVGNQVNIGCGFITCNYDGKEKKRTIIEDGVFVGSDSQTIAPVTIGKNAYVASGTTLTKSVPEGALAIARVRQENKLNYAAVLRRLRKN
jgi:bifunctional UDP-N-acetylglucosamine pyrophosphorylase/glucosamine-1-phosphate N-acetyltransferase